MGTGSLLGIIIAPDTACPKLREFHQDLLPSLSLGIVVALPIRAITKLEKLVESDFVLTLGRLLLSFQVTRRQVNHTKLERQRQCRPAPAPADRFPPF